MKYAINQVGEVVQPDGAAKHDVDRLGVWRAFSNLTAALRRCGIGGETGPMPVVFALTAADYDRLRDTMVGADDFSRQFFVRPRRKKVNAGDRHTMIAGIPIVSSDL